MTVLMLSISFAFESCRTGERKILLSQYGDTIACRIESDSISLLGTLALDDYPVTANGTLGAYSGVIGYNYRLHSLDVIDREHENVFSVPLKREGPNGVSGSVKSICPVSGDSIWLSDGFFVYLADSMGNVKKRISLEAGNLLLLETNYAMHTSKLVYSKERDLLYFPARNKDTISLNAYDVRQERVAHRYLLHPSLVDGGKKTNRADLRYPNVNVVGDTVLYNYPYESNIYLLDMSTGQTNVIGAASDYVSNGAPECAVSSDYSVWQRYGLENTHFYQG